MSMMPPSSADPSDEGVAGEEPDVADDDATRPHVPDGESEPPEVSDAWPPRD
jgi:hypothetical protein